MSSTPARPRWKRVLVKLSGEALMGGLSHGLDQPTLLVVQILRIDFLAEPAYQRRRLPGARGAEEK